MGSSKKESEIAKKVQKSVSRKKQKEPIRKKCDICGKFFETFYKTSHLCSQECIQHYNKANGGRPPITLDAIKEAVKPYLQIGCSETEAILESGICSKDTFYRYKRENEGFSDRIESMQNFSIIKAKRLVYKKISDGDKHAAMRRLEKKRPYEFGKTITETTIKGDAENPVQIFIPDN